MWRFGVLPGRCKGSPGVQGSRRWRRTHSHDNAHVFHAQSISRPRNRRDKDGKEGDEAQHEALPLAEGGACMGVQGGRAGARRGWLETGGVVQGRKRSSALQHDAACSEIILACKLCFAQCTQTHQTGHSRCNRRSLPSSRFEWTSTQGKRSLRASSWSRDPLCRRAGTQQTPGSPAEGWQQQRVDAQLGGPQAGEGRALRCTSLACRARA